MLVIFPIRKWKSLSHVWLFTTPWTIQSMEFFRPEYWSGSPFPSPGGLPNLGIEPRSPTLQANYLPAEPQGKPKNTGVGRLSFLQGILLTQESNQGLLRWRQILNQLNYQGSPFSPMNSLLIKGDSGLDMRVWTMESSNVNLSQLIYDRTKWHQDFPLKGS